MREEAILFGSDPRLSGRYAYPDHPRATVVFTHPHPLYGGSMSNNVVRLGCRRFHEHGFATLRFDYRGVGDSEGRYDGGEGEQQDLVAALAEARWRANEWLEPGDDLRNIPLIAIGYSFGSYVVHAALSQIEDLAAAVLISPPLGLAEYPFSAPSIPHPPLAAFIGSQDDICPQSVFDRKIGTLGENVHTHVYPGMDHFWLGGENELIDDTVSWLLAILPIQD